MGIFFSWADLVIVNMVHARTKVTRLKCKHTRSFQQQIDNLPLHICNNKMCSLQTLLTNDTKEVEAVKCGNPEVRWKHGTR